MIQKIQDQQFTDKRALLPFLKRLLGYATKQKQWFRLFIFTIIMVGIFDAIYPLIWLYYLDNAIVPLLQQYTPLLQKGITPTVDVLKLAGFASLFILTGSVQVIGVYFFVKYAGYIQEQVMYELRREMFVRLQQLSFSFFDRSAQGWLLSRITSDTERVTELVSWGLLEFTWGLTMIIACSSAMLYYDWRLALIVLITLPLLIALSIKISLLILHYSRQSRHINSEITATFNEHVAGVETNKVTAQEQRVSNNFASLTNRMRASSYKSAFFTALNMPLVIFIGSIAGGIVLYVGGQMAMAIPAGITVGTLAAFFNYATQIFWPILDIASFYGSAQHSLSAGERIFSLIDEQPEITDKPNATNFDTIQGNIQFANLSFAYVPDKPVLHNINLNIKAGTSVALVGATGGGKSSLINLVCRFYEPTSGALLIDGTDYLTKTIHSLRTQLGVVLQTPHLFSGTIRDNIKYGRNQATDQEIADALKQVGAEQFITQLNDEVGEGGSRLSMGERQLLSFSRAILTNPRILIMDEATSAIDTLTEAVIQRGIAQMVSGRTSLIIAHRLSTIKHCDRILVVKNGAIVEDGTHTELIKQQSHYYQLYTQYAEQETNLSLIVND